tara:strand:- start:10389 stop:12644 length:2256 start_codon:yes stop_codon:yes gene_type:complete
MNKDEKSNLTDKETENIDQNVELNEQESPIDEAENSEIKKENIQSAPESEPEVEENVNNSEKNTEEAKEEPAKEEMDAEGVKDSSDEPTESKVLEDHADQPETESDVKDELESEEADKNTDAPDLSDMTPSDEEEDEAVVTETETESEADVSDEEVEDASTAGAEADTSKEIEPDNVTEKVEADAESEAVSEEKEESAEGYYAELADKAESLLNLSDWAMASMEFDNIDHLWKEGPDPEEADIKPYREKIDRFREQLEEKKKAHYELQKKIREENLGKKKDLLKEFKQIIDDEKWSHTRDVARIRNRWDKIKPIPAEETENLEASFTAFLSTFDEHKVDRLVKKKQEEEDNLTVKLVILEKMETFIEGIDEKSEWAELDKKLAEYVRQFRKIGRIPSDKNQETWDRFYEAQDTFHSMRFKYDSNYRKEIEKFLSKKKKLIDEAEALLDSDDLADAARKVNKLHRRWKKIGNLPQKDENEMWDRFKAATDAFNEKKSENIDELRDQEEENYNEKLKLIEKAVSIQDSEEWESTHKEYQKLMNEWKKVGPVPRKKSGKIWKKFKGAMDHFYDRRRDYFKEVKEERKDNLKEKDEIINQLKALASHDNPVEAVELAKPLQEEFKKAGYVPIKHKNRLWKEYREACDVIYDRFRAAKSAVEIVGKENIDQFSNDDLSKIKKKQDQVNNLRKQISKQSSELIQMKESLSYFKPSKGGSSILDDAKKRIENSEKEIADKEQQLNKLEVEIDKLKRTD